MGSVTTENIVTVTEDDSTETEPPTTESQTTEVETPAPICTLGEFGNVANPDSCAEYYLCLGGMEFLQSCPDNYEFDPNAKVRN